jgi:hypothetical protein
MKEEQPHPITMPSVLQIVLIPKGLIDSLLGLLTAYFSSVQGRWD